jgi:hypothetical protein
MCLAVGSNPGTIEDGVIAIVTVALTPDAGGTTTISVTDALGASARGEPIIMSAESGTISTPPRDPAVAIGHRLEQGPFSPQVPRSTTFKWGFIRAAIVPSASYGVGKPPVQG